MNLGVTDTPELRSHSVLLYTRNLKSHSTVLYSFLLETADICVHLSDVIGEDEVIFLSLLHDSIR